MSVLERGRLVTATSRTKRGTSKQGDHAQSGGHTRANTHNATTRGHHDTKARAQRKAEQQTQGKAHSPRKIGMASMAAALQTSRLTSSR